MKPLFQLTTLGLLTAFLVTGCSTSKPIPSISNEKIIRINAVTPQGIGAEIGTISLKDSSFGLILTTNLSNLPAGPHGFHIHEKGSCDPAEKDGKMGAALAAGSHYNPQKFPHHGDQLIGHFGDLPLLKVEQDGSAKVSLVAPRLKVSDVEGLAIMVHAGGDNYSDNPKPLGGGGDRIACGVIK